MWSELDTRLDDEDFARIETVLALSFAAKVISLVMLVIDLHPLYFLTKTMLT
jgi:hypothetical protein